MPQPSQGGKSKKVEVVPEATKKRLIAFRESCHLLLVSSLPPISLGRLCSQRWQLRLRELSLKTCVPGCVPGYQRPGCSLLQIYCCTTVAEKKRALCFGGINVHFSVSQALIDSGWMVAQAS